jgi:hypothetical protein
MAFAATASTKEPRSFSIGTRKIQIMTYTAASGDTSGTVTATSLSRIDHIILDGKIAHTALPTVSGNVATLAFADPAADAFGTVICIGI